MRNPLTLHRSLLVPVLGVLLYGNAPPASAQRPTATAARLSASEATTQFRSSITLSMGQSTTRRTPPDGMTFLEVRALLATRDSTFQPIMSDSVYLLVGPGGQRGRRHQLQSLGVYRTDACLWADLGALVSGAVTTTFESGDGYGLSRTKEGGPLTITFQKNPNRTCLLFAVPLRTTGVLRLRLGAYETLLRLPSSEGGR